MAHNSKETLILGAGTAGLALGYFLRKSGYTDFFILEKNSDPGKKLSVAGGGMGNLTNKHMSYEYYVGKDPLFAKEILLKFSYKKVMELIKSLHLKWEEREFGQIFGTQSINYFIEALSYGLPIQCNTEVEDVDYANELFTVKTTKQTFTCKNLIVATGSPAWPQTGATSIGLEIAKDFSIKNTPFMPVLVPCSLVEESPLKGLQGISVNVGFTWLKKKIIRPLLFTHTGISGPACLILSCYDENRKNMELDFLPEKNVIELCHNGENGKLLLKNLLCRYLPDRLALALIPENIQNKKVAELSKAEREKLAQNVHKHNLAVRTGSLAKAEACKGGVLTEELNTNLSTKKNSNLFFCGEVTDITGLLGGYNIHYALASAYCVHAEILKRV